MQHARAQAGPKHSSDIWPVASAAKAQEGTDTEKVIKVEIHRTDDGWTPVMHWRKCTVSHVDHNRNTIMLGDVEVAIGDVIIAVDDERVNSQQHLDNMMALLTKGRAHPAEAAANLHESVIASGCTWL